MESSPPQVSTVSDTASTAPLTIGDLYRITKVLEYLGIEEVRNVAMILVLNYPHCKRLNSTTDIVHNWLLRCDNVIQNGGCSWDTLAEALARSLTENRTAINSIVYGNLLPSLPLCPDSLIYSVSNQLWCPGKVNARQKASQSFLVHRFFFPCDRKHYNAAECKISNSRNAPGRHTSPEKYR